MAGRRKKQTHNRRAVYRKVQSEKLSIAVISIVLIIFCAVMGFQTLEKKKELEAYQAKEAYYQALIEDENLRAKELAEFEQYTKTKAYAEEVARTKLGLVKDGEIIFVAQ
ncbi:MAG: septum formation initiator family protein [Lachnospiraceae bacterium]|nr:septum formation initiator family protein [Lachnospiraceae bacterium]